MTDPESPAPAFELNEQQQRAVDHAAGPLMVLAGPGTGKTRVIIERIANLIEQRSADPASILAVTFTVKATEQMRTKLAERLAHNARAADKVRIRTFHGFGRELLQRFADYINLPTNPTVIDSAQRRRLLRAIVAEHNLYAHTAAEGLSAAVDRAIRFTEKCRQSAKFPGDALAYAHHWRRRHEARRDWPNDDARIADAALFRHFESGAKAFAEYEHRCLKRGWITLDDFIAHPITLLRDHAEVAAIVRTETRHIVVDEFQDVNPAQIELLRLLAPPDRNPDLCVVGDDDQAIYQFRGSDPRSMAHFKTIWPNHKTEKLEVNYRSRKAIIDVANDVIAPADRIDPDKQSKLPEKPHPDGGSVECILTDNEVPNGAAIAAMILIDRQQTERDFSAYAVLTRGHSDADNITADLRAQGLPVNRREKRTPLQDPAVQDLLSWARLLSDEQSTSDAQRLLARPPFNIPLTRVSELSREFAAARKRDNPPPSFIQHLRQTAHPTDTTTSFLSLYDDLLKVAAAHDAAHTVEQIIHRAIAHAEALDGRDRAGRVTNLVAVIRFARRIQPFLDPPAGLAEFLAYHADLDPKDQDFADTTARVDANDPDPEQDEAVSAITVITAHAAKGLEFDTVFVARCQPQFGFPNTRGNNEESPLPADFSGINPLGQDEEERRLFYVACTRAQRRLVLLTKPTKARSQAKLHFMRELRENDALNLTEVSEQDWISRAPLADADPLDEQLSATGDHTPTARDAILRAEFTRARQSAFAALHETERNTTGAVPPAAHARLLDAAATIAALSHLRAHNNTPPDLSALSPDARQHIHAVADRIARDQGPVWPRLPAPLALSYSKLTDYLACPRCFLVKYVLNLDEPKTPELSVGQIVHVALERFFKEYQLADAEGAPLPTRDRLLHLCAHAFQAETRAEASISDAESAARLSEINALALNALEHLHDNANILHIEASVKLPYKHNSKTHTITAKLDRVDQLRSGAFRIVDYKTGQSSQRLLEPKKDDLQMAIYAMALPVLLEDPEFDVTFAGKGGNEGGGGVAEYWLLRTAQRGTIGFDAIDFDKVRDQIDEAIAGILAGNYERNDSKCKGLCEIIG